MPDRQTRLTGQRGGGLALDPDLAHQVAFVGPLPPPLHGFSSVSAMMLDELKQRTSVAVFDRAKRQNGLGRELFQQLFQVVRFINVSRKDRELTLYIALSGGKSQLLDLLYILVGTFFRQRAFVHHHSFAYVNYSTIINKLLFSLLRHQTHIVLSKGMATALAKRYSLDQTKISIVSNAAFFAKAPMNPRRPFNQDTEPPVRVGFLANITFDKGFVEFFDVLGRLRSLNVDYRAYVAGPVAPAAHQVFDRLCTTHSDVEYAGGVFGEAKDQFYRQLDILLFPTKYANEAEPLVIHEALRSGVYVIASNLGAIADTLDNGAGLVFPLESFVDSAAQCIRGLSSDPAKLIEGQRLALEQSQRLRAGGSAALAKVLKEIVFQTISQSGT